MKIIGVIPARYESKKFPGKILADVYGKPMLVRTFENVSKANEVDDVVVAIDDERTREVSEKFLLIIMSL